MAENNPSSNVNHSMDPRRIAKEQGEKLDQATAAIQGLLRPYMEMWALSFKLTGENLIAAGNLVNNLSQDHRQQY